MMMVGANLAPVHRQANGEVTGTGLWLIRAPVCASLGFL